MQLVFWNADAAVCYFQAQIGSTGIDGTAIGSKFLLELATIGKPPRQLHSSLLWSKFDRIREKVNQDLAYAPFIQKCLLQTRVEFQRQSQSFLIGTRLNHFQALATQCLNRYRCQVKVSFPGFNFRQIENVVN